MDLNVIMLVGRLTRDPEYHPPGARGQEHCSFTLAVNRVVPDSNGPQADYLPCSLWGPEAKPFFDNRAKGDEVGLTGRLRANRVQEAGGSSRTYFEVRVDEIHKGRRALKNLQPAPKATPTTHAVGRLQSEFSS